jgi:hypothetical protein
MTENFGELKGKDLAKSFFQTDKNPVKESPEDKIPACPMP